MKKNVSQVPAPLIELPTSRTADNTHHEKQNVDILLVCAKISKNRLLKTYSLLCDLGMLV